jgi:2-methylcitrate dehydratase PrpD
MNKNNNLEISTHHSARLAAHLASLTPALLDGPIGNYAAMALLDTVGCGLYGANQQWGRILREQILGEGSRGKATLFGENGTVAPSRAALVNGTASHGFELDDIIQGALVHPGAVVIPAALAVAQHTGASGERLLLGIVAGYEVMARLGLALGAEHNTRGYHTTGVAGPIAATVAAGTVRGQPVDTILSAIGIACSSAGGIKAFTQGTGGMVKRMHAGRAAETGVLACELAQRGFTGPMAGVDGHFGLIEVIGGTDTDVAALTRDLGREYAISKVWVKAYPCCGLIHSVSHAIEAIRKESSLTPADVKNIVVHTSRRAVEHNGDPNPQETMAAQYSIPYCAGAAVVRNPRDPAAFDEQGLRDPEIRRVAALTQLRIDEKMDALYPAHFAARVQIVTNNARQYEQTVIDPHGTVTDACEAAEIEAKFRLLAKPVQQPQRIDQVIDTLRELRGAATVAAFSAALHA